MGNKFYSQLLTLMYLAVWHGYHLGYFILFAFEMSCMYNQQQLYALIAKLPALQEFLSRSYIRPFVWIFGKLTINISMGYVFFTFGLIKKEIWIKVSFLYSTYCYIFQLVDYITCIFSLSSQCIATGTFSTSSYYRSHSSSFTKQSKNRKRKKAQNPSNSKLFSFLVLGQKIWVPWPNT